MAAHGDITSFTFLPETVLDQTMLDAFNANARIEFLIQGARFADGYELIKDDGYWTYGFWRKAMAQTDNFVTTAWPSGAAYDKMLWVVEHSYPAISMEAMMHDAGADYDRLYQEVAAGQSTLSPAALDELVETIVYATIQEAIWHHQPAKINDDPERYVGAQLIQGHQDTKLLYEYLTQEREEYDGYRNKVFGTDIAIVHPDDLTPAQNGSGCIYGPFSISSDMLSAGTIQLSIEADGVNASVTDAEGASLNAVRAGQEFYVRTDAPGRYPVAQSRDRRRLDANAKRSRPDVCPHRCTASSGTAARWYRRHTDQGLRRRYIGAARCRAPGYSGPLRRASQFYEDGRGYPSPLGWRGDSGR